MRVEIKPPGKPYTLFDADITGEVTLSKVFNGVGIFTEDEHHFGVAQRDTGLEVKCPDGAMIEIKVNDEGDTFVVTHGVKRG